MHCFKIAKNNTQFEKLATFQKVKQYLIFSLGKKREIYELVIHYIRYCDF